MVAPPSSLKVVETGDIIWNEKSDFWSLYNDYNACFFLCSETISSQQCCYSFFVVTVVSFRWFQNIKLGGYVEALCICERRGKMSGRVDFYTNMSIFVL